MIMVGHEGAGILLVAVALMLGQELHDISVQ